MTASPDAIRVVLVDDHPATRSGIVSTLRDHADILVVAETATAADAVAVAARARPDVVVMDLRLEHSSGIEATRDIRAAHPEMRVLMFSSFADDEGVYAALMAGASGYVLKSARTDQLVEAIRTVHRGESLLDPAVTAAVLNHLRQATGAGVDRDDRLARLTAQEERVLSHVAIGQTNREIAEAMHLSEKTVKNYVAGILEKLEVARRTQAAAYLAARKRKHSA